MNLSAVSRIDALKQICTQVSHHVLRFVRLSIETAVITVPLPNYPSYFSDPVSASPNVREHIKTLQIHLKVQNVLSTESFVHSQELTWVKTVTTTISASGSRRAKQ